jgi:hypothetical protein
MAQMVGMPFFVVWAWHEWLSISPFFFFLSICFITRDDEIPRLKENYSLYILKLIETFKFQ